MIRKKLLDESHCRACLEAPRIRIERAFLIE